MGALKGDLGGLAGDETGETEKVNVRTEIEFKKEKGSRRNF